MRGQRAVGVITVDDQAAFRDVAREVIEATAGFEPIGEAACGEEAVVLAGDVEPDLVLLDVRMPGIDGLETARRLSAAHPAATIVLVSTERLEGPSAGVESCGAAAMIRKDEFGPSTLRRLWSEHGPAPS